MKKFDLWRIDPLCWLCGKYQEPEAKYGPLICYFCLPAYKKRKFLFVRASQQELDKLFPVV